MGVSPVYSRWHLYLTNHLSSLYLVGTSCVALHKTWQSPKDKELKREIMKHTWSLKQKSFFPVMF